MSLLVNGYTNWSVGDQITKNIWCQVTQFVCWEFCRRTDEFLSQSDPQTPPDLFGFLRDMIVQLTKKEDETELDAFEMVAKFIEELCLLKTPQMFRSVSGMGRAIERMFPVLAPCIKDLLSYVKERLHNSRSYPFTKNKEFCRLVIKLSKQVCRFFQEPKLLEEAQAKAQNSLLVVNPKIVVERIKKELTPAIISQIMAIMSKDSQQNNLASFEDSSSKLPTPNSDCEYSVSDDEFVSYQDPQSPQPTSEEFMDCETGIIEKSDEVIEVDKKDHDDSELNASRLSVGSSSSFSSSETKKCSVRLVDIFKEEADNPEVQKYIKAQSDKSSATNNGPDLYESDISISSNHGSTESKFRKKFRRSSAVKRIQISDDGSDAEFNEMDNADSEISDVPSVRVSANRSCKKRHSPKIRASPSRQKKSRISTDSVSSQQNDSTPQSRKCKACGMVFSFQASYTNHMVQGCKVLHANSDQSSSDD